MKERPQYRTWIRIKRVFAFWALTVVFLLTTVLSILTLWFLLLLIPAFIFLYVAVIVTLTFWRFSARGGDYQNKIHELLLAQKTTPGETVDIGCGNGSLIIKVAKADNSSEHLGLDSWEKNWEYSKRQCQVNARIEGVANVAFAREDAASIGLEDGSFQYVVSCLTFHEVRDQPDRARVVAEALRILKPGGTYIFFDLFDDTTYYPSLQKLLTTIELAGCTVTVNAPLSDLMRLPYPLNDKNALRYARLLSGQKTLPH